MSRYASSLTSISAGTKCFSSNLSLLLFGSLFDDLLRDFLYSGCSFSVKKSSMSASDIRMQANEDSYYSLLASRLGELGAGGSTVKPCILRISIIL